MQSCPVCDGRVGDPEFLKSETREVAELEQRVRPIRRGWNVAGMIFDIVRELLRR